MSKQPAVGDLWYSTKNTKFYALVGDDEDERETESAGFYCLVFNEDKSFAHTAYLFNYFFPKSEMRHVGYIHPIEVVEYGRIE